MAWQAITEPEVRLRIGLAAVYAYNAQTEQMSNALVHDLQDFPVLRDVLTPYFVCWDTVGTTLTAGWNDTDASCLLVRAAIGHAISFVTWRSLVRDQAWTRLMPSISWWV